MEIALKSGASATQLRLDPIQVSDVESFRECLDTVAREKRYLALFEAPSLDHMRRFVTENIEKNVAHLVVRDGDRVVGWCDIAPGWHHAYRHCGSLGMGLLSEYRNKGLGAQMLQSCIALAKQNGLSRIELEVRVDNIRAAKLYRRIGFVREGQKRNGMMIDGIGVDTEIMSLLLDSDT
jgi:RimJ/RimL family protein N-acetyltransferase